VLATENQFMLLGPDLTEQTALPLSSPTRLSA
jgi:hypothetical protein